MSSSSSSSVVAALQRLAISNTAVAELIHKMNQGTDVSIEQRLQNVSAGAQQSLVDSILEYEADNKNQLQEEASSFLHLVSMDRCVDSPMYTHVHGSGPALVVKVTDTKGEETIILLKLEVLLSHLDPQSGRLRDARVAAEAETTPIDYLAQLRVFESDDVYCTMREQPYHCELHDGQAQVKRQRKRKEGGLTFVRDRVNAFQLCAACIVSVCRTGESLNADLTNTRGVGHLNDYRLAPARWSIARKTT
jgi:hypothetical protein